MKRRAFLRLVGGLALAAGLRPRVAQGGTMALKGISANNLLDWLVNPTNIGWMKTGWGAFCTQPLINLNPSILWCFHLYDEIPNPILVAAAQDNNPNYNRWWFVGGNEPDLNGTSPKQTKQLATAQMDMVLAGDPDAKFCLTMGSQVNAFGGQSVVPYVVKVWEKLDPFYRSKIRAFHTHYYAQVAMGENNPAIYDTQDLKNFCDAQNAGLMALEGWNKNQLVWIDEIGLVKSTLTNSDPRTITYPTAIHQALEGKAGRWALYGFEDVQGYHSIYDNGAAGVLSAYGANFAAL